MDNVDWAQMNFDPELSVNVHALIYVMRGGVATLTEDQWEEAKKCCADVMERFLDLRREVEFLKSNMQFRADQALHLEAHFIRTHGLEAYRVFRRAREKLN
jgi:hypothetical protein